MARPFNFAGHTIGELTVVGSGVPQDESNNSWWECHTPSGEVKHIRTDHLLAMLRKLDPEVDVEKYRPGSCMVGRRFGRLVVVAPTIPPRKRTYWDCVCDCGGTASVAAHQLLSGKTQSCGCLCVERMKQNRFQPDRIDLMGQRFGRLVVIGPSEEKDGSNYKWLVRCDCGTEKLVSGRNLRGNLTISCGCYRRVLYPGMRFGRLLVIRETDKRHKSGNILWEVACDCGTIKLIPSGYLSNGDTQSCGCLARDLFRERSRTHGLSKSPEYGVWVNMRARCYDPDAVGYSNYGGRGITICDRWRTSFADFIKDMGRKPFPKAQIDRANNDGNYEPENCRWVTVTENARNTRHCVMVEHAGITKPISAWAEELVIDYSTVHKKIQYEGWTIQQIIDWRAAIGVK